MGLKEDVVSVAGDNFLNPGSFDYEDWELRTVFKPMHP